MGMYPMACVAYGYALGGTNNGWLVEGLGEYGEFQRPWMEAAEDGDCATQILRTLLLADGMTPEELEGKDYFELDDPLMARRHLKLDMFGHGGYGFDNYALCAGGNQTAYAYTPEVIEFSKPETADADLAWALEVLDIVPAQKHAAWIFYPSYG